MKLYTQDEYKIHLLSESVELDTDDMLLMEAVEEADDILKELNDIANIEDNNIEGKARNTVSKFKRWWYGLNPEKKHQKLHKVLTAITSTLKTLIGVIAVVSFPSALIIKEGKVKVILALAALISGLMLFIVSSMKSKNEIKVAASEKDSYDKYIDTLDELINKLKKEKSDAKDQKVKSQITKEINSLISDRNQILRNIGIDYFANNGDIDNLNKVRVKPDGDDELYFILYEVKDKNGELILHNSSLDDPDIKNYLYGYSKNEILEIRNQFRKRPYAFAVKEDYEDAYGPNTYDKAMEKFKNKFSQDDKPYDGKNKRLLSYMKFNPSEFNKYVYDHFFGKGAHEKALKKYKYTKQLKESSVVLDTAMTLVEAGEIESAQILLNTLNESDALTRHGYDGADPAGKRSGKPWVNENRIDGDGEIIPDSNRDSDKSSKRVDKLNTSAQNERMSQAELRDQLKRLEARYSNMTQNVASKGKYSDTDVRNTKSQINDIRNKINASQGKASQLTNSAKNIIDDRNNTENRANNTFYISKKGDAKLISDTAKKYGGKTMAKEYDDAYVDYNKRTSAVNTQPVQQPQQQPVQQVPVQQQPVQQAPAQRPKYDPAKGWANQPAYRPVQQAPVQQPQQQPVQQVPTQRPIQQVPAQQPQQQPVMNQARRPVQPIQRPVMARPVPFNQQSAPVINNAVRTDAANYKAKKVQSTGR